VTARELTHFVRERLAGLKVRKQIVLGGLPKTSTGKVQMNGLRSMVVKFER
jgi:acyl-CoA synthetase (AMP-forming)/AMP-acid ligase II